MPLIRYDLRRPAEDGGFETRYWRITHYPILDAAGELLYILQHPEDVTAQHQAEQERHAAEQALNLMQQRAQFILEALPVMVWTAQPDGSIDYLNRRWLDFTGHAATADLADAWSQYLHPDDLPGLTQGWTQAMTTRQAFEAEFRLRRHDGQYRWVLARTVPQAQPDGSISLWVGSGLDVHTQKLMVQELTEANEQQMLLSDQAYQAAHLAQSQRKTFHDLFMQAPALIAIVRGPQYVFDIIPEAAEQGYIALLDQVYQTGEAFHGTEMLVQLHRRGTGQIEERYFDIAYQAFRENGQIVGIFSFAFDVTERVQMRRQLAQLQHPNGPTHA
jgi:PAS domain S-box-containing protein